MSTELQTTTEALAVKPDFQITPAQARIESVSSALDAAYRNASNLKLTPEEAQALAADFPDEAFSLGAGGDANLLYIEHAYLRQRLNQVLGVGAATPIRRREWVEEFTYVKDRQERKGVRVYVDLALLVRGCLVGEAIGDGVYYPHNQNDSYSDTLEKAKSNAFRRTCKEFGVGLQVWMKGWCEGWKQRQRQRAKGRSDPPMNTAQTTKTRPEPTQAPKPAATAADVLPKAATEADRIEAVNLLSSVNGPDAAWNFLIFKGWAKDDWQDWNLALVPVAPGAMAKLLAELEDWIKANTPPSESAADDLPPEIANVVITVPRKGMKKSDYDKARDTIGSLRASGDEEDRKRLWGLVMNYEPLPYTSPTTGKIFEPTKEDFAMRAGLDAYKEWSEKDLIP